MNIRFLITLIFCEVCCLHASEIQVRLKIAPYEVVERLEHLAVCAEQSDQTPPVFFELKSSIVDEEKRQVTQIWRSSIRDGVYDILVRDEPNMMGVLRFAGKRITVKSGESVSLDFDLIYNEMIIIPKWVDGSDPRKGDGSLTMILQENRSDHQFAQHQRSPLYFDKNHQMMVARFYFVRNAAYQCTLRSIESTGDGLLKSEEWFGEITLPGAIPKMKEVVFVKK